MSRNEVSDPIVLELFNRKFGRRDPAQEPGVTASGAPGNYEAVLAHSPDCLAHAAEGFYLKQTKARKLPLKFMELAIARIGWASSCRWMFSEHIKILRGLGYAEGCLNAIPAWQASDLFDPAERCVLAYADCIAHDHGRVADQLFAQLKQWFDDEQLVELTYIASMFLMHATLIRALRLEHDDAEDWVKEMPSPEGYEFRNLEPPSLPRRP